MAGRRLVEHAWRWSMIYSIRPKTAQPAPAAPAPGSPHSLHWVTLSREQRPGEQPLQMSGWRAASGGGGSGDTWTHTRHTKTSSQWCGTVVHTAACNQRSTSTQPTNIHTKLTALLCYLLPSPSPPRPGLSGRQIPRTCHTTFQVELETNLRKI